MNASSWPMFLLRTLNGAEMTPAAFFKKVRRKGLLVNMFISIGLVTFFSENAKILPIVCSTRRQLLFKTTLNWIGNVQN